jgi:hypothetical protein
MERAISEGGNCENLIEHFCIPSLSLDLVHHSAVEFWQATWYLLDDVQDER